MTGVKRKKRITSGKQNSLELSSSDTGQSSTDRKLAVHLAGPGGDHERQQTDDYPLATNLFRVTKFDFGWFIHTDNPKNMTPMQIVNIQSRLFSIYTGLNSTFQKCFTSYLDSVKGGEPFYWRATVFVALFDQNS